LCPTVGEGKGVRSFAVPVPQVVRAHLAFCKEFEGRQPDKDCPINGKEAKRSKAEIMGSLRDSLH